MALTPTTTGTGAASETGHPRRRQILLVLCCSLLVVTIDNTILNTALPTLARALGAGTSALQWIVDAYTLCFAGLLVTAGAIGDRFGRRRMLVAGLVGFAAGSALAALASGTASLIADRALMGVGAAFVMPATLSILSDVFPPAERARAIAAWSAVAGVGILLGPTLGGLLLERFWWGSIFLVNVPLAAATVVAVVAVVPASRGGGAARLDLAGALTSAGGLFALVDAIIEAPSAGWLAPSTLGLLALSAAALSAFVRIELTRDHPLIDLRVFADRALSVASGALGLTFFALFGSLFALTQYLQLVHGYSPLAAGVRALAFAAAMGAVAPFSTAIAERLGTRVTVTVGLAAMAAGLAALSLAEPSTTYPFLAAATAVMGAGMGLVMAPASATVMATVPAGQAGAGSAVNDTVREVGGALGVAVIGSIVHARYHASMLGELARAHALPPAAGRLAASSVAAGDLVARHLGAGGAGVTADAHTAFTLAMATGMRVGAAVALAGAVAAGLLLPARRARRAPARSSLRRVAPSSVAPARAA